MARSIQVTVENNFTRGLITEATALNFPQNAATAMSNCLLDSRGIISRRLGFDYESSYAQKNISRGTSVINDFLWKDAIGDGSKTFVVVQVGGLLHFYETGVTEAISGGVHATTVDLTDFSPAGAPSPGAAECQFAEGLNSLYVVHPDLDPFKVDYDSGGDTFTTAQTTVEIRDFQGSTADTLALDERPTVTVGAMDIEHKYNLFNQGWYHDTNAALTTWDGGRTDLPSSADVWWAYKNSLDAFAVAVIPLVTLGNTPAPKGHYILDAFNPDRDTASGLSGVTDEYAAGTNRFSTIAFFAGRVWYAGLNYQGLSSNIYFSQIIEKDAQLGHCYQANDPTSEVVPDLLASDGGLISIQDGGSIIKMFPFQGALLIFTTNGIWAIAGSEGVGFSANDFAIQKISSIPALSATSFTESAGSPVWWNSDGIYTVVSGEGGATQVQSLTDRTIKSLFRDIPLASKSLARGAYNSVENKIHWVYRTTTALDPDDTYEFDAVLTLDTLSSAFSPWTLTSTNDVQIHGVLAVEATTSTLQEVIVVDDSPTNVVDDSGNVVIIYEASNPLIAPVFKYLVSVAGASNHDFTFAESKDPALLDWAEETSTGIDFSSSFTTGYKIQGNAQRFFQSNYVFVFLEQETVSGSCLMRGIWDFASNTASNKYSSQQQIYNSALLNRTVNFRRLKIRGKGRALQLSFNSETGQPFSIIGWSTFDTVNDDL